MNFTLIITLTFSIFLLNISAKAGPLIVNAANHGENTCVYYDFTYSDAENCITVRTDLVDNEGWSHHFGDVTCSDKCGLCSHVNITAYIYDKYGKTWVSYPGWYGQKMSIEERRALYTQLSPFLKPSGDINKLSCKPDYPCGQMPSITKPKYVDSQQYGKNTCVYYDYSADYYAYTGGITIRKNITDDEGWYYRFGDWICDRNCGNYYRLFLTTYIFDKNTNTWVSKTGWSGQSIKPQEACDLLESIKMYHKPDGDIRTVECAPLKSEYNFGYPPDKCR